MVRQEAKSSMQTTHTTSRRQGFTLVEMMVAIPVAILVVVVLVAFMIMLVGSVYTSAGRVGAVYRAQDTLDRIEQDVRYGGAFLGSTGTLPPYQGSDATATSAGTGKAFTPSSSSSTLVIQQYATTASPYSSSRELVYYAYPDSTACSQNTKVYNTPVQVMIIYYLSGTTLYRRTIVPQSTIAPTAPYPLCSTPWQRNTCLHPLDTTLVCRGLDDQVATDVSGVSFAYYASAGSSSSIPVSGGTTPRTVVASITTTSTVAGNTISYTSSMRASLINN